MTRKINNFVDESDWSFLRPLRSLDLRSFRGFHLRKEFSVSGWLFKIGLKSPETTGLPASSIPPQRAKRKENAQGSHPFLSSLSHPSTLSSYYFYSSFCCHSFVWLSYYLIFMILIILNFSLLNELN
jgi:hypothetical protein